MKKYIAVLLMLFVTLAFFGCGEDTDKLFSGGEGTAENPYQISTKADLRQLSNLTQDAKGGSAYNKAHFVMTADIDLGGSRFSSMFAVSGFRGVFDGNGHTITGLNIDYQKPLMGNPQKDHGLFASGTDAVIKNLTISNSELSVTTDSGHIGAFMGYANDVTFENCHVTETVTITSSYIAGGIVGHTSGTITGCTNAAAVTASGNVGKAGGIAAHSGAVITDCRNTGAITGESDAGGIAAVQNAAITGCENTGAVFARKYNAGGISGTFGDGALNKRENDESVTMSRCVNSGSVTSEKGDAAGIAARTSTGIIRECENSGDVCGSTMAGGILAAFQESAFGDAASRFTVERCTNSGNVDSKEVLGMVGYSGGICGWINGADTVIEIRDCENSGDVTGQGYSAGMAAGFNGTHLQITQCKNTGDVAGFESCGGMVGKASPTGEALCTVTITGCTNSGNVFAGLASGFAGLLMDSYAGGMVGRTTALENQQQVQLTIDDCENTGVLEAEGEAGHIHTDPMCAGQGLQES